MREREGLQRGLRFRDGGRPQSEGFGLHHSMVFLKGAPAAFWRDHGNHLHIRPFDMVCTGVKGLGFGLSC